MNPQNKETTNFLDSKTLLAMALTFAFFLGWRWFMDWKYPKPPESPIVQSIESAKPKETEKPSLAPTANNPAPVENSGEKKEVFTDFDSPQMSFQISSIGMGLRAIHLKEYKNRNNEPIILGEVNDNLPFSTSAAGQSPIQFSVEKVGDNQFVGHGRVGSSEIIKTMKVHPDEYYFDVEVSVQKPGDDFKGIETRLSEPLVDPKSSSFLVPNYDRQDFLVHFDQGKSKRSVINKEKGTELIEKNVDLMAINAHYFSMAVLDSKTLLPRFEGKALPGASVATAKMVYEPLNKTDLFSVHYKGYAGPKSFRVLESVDPELGSLVDYGFFGILGKPLWYLLNFCFSLVGNYGFAIILMTLVVRACVLPFNIYSFKSMKAMQKIQPQLNALKVRYKDDPRQLNSETMALMKANKANPLGGCLPMLLQLPIFFALYQVLGQSIELYRAPFILWIQDLSMSDRYYVLPVLMAGAMFFQQKLTPTAMDPAQAKVMQWMPLLFAFFMLSLPSGLTLYILVSTLFGIGQQVVLARDRKRQVPVLEPKPGGSQI